MGKRKLDKIELIKDDNVRKVTSCKRKKGLLKKSIELSLLCDLSMFIFIYDKNHDRCVHYASDTNQNLLHFFNWPCHREFYTNNDYLKMGGKEQDLPSSIILNDQNDDNANEKDNINSEQFANSGQGKQQKTIDLW